MDTTQASLLERIKDRSDSAAWREFDAIYRPMLKRFALVQGLDHQQADDVVQHGMAAIVQHIENFEYDPQRGRFRGWLRTVVNNRVRSLRRQPRENQADSPAFERTQTREPSPDELFDRIWQQEHLRYCLDRVKTEVEETTYRAFVAHVLDDQSVEQVCAAMNMTRNQVQLIKWRLTNKLRLCMKRLVNEPD